MLGTIVNALAIIVGGTVGVFLKNGLKENYRQTIMNGLGLAVIVIGLMDAIGADNILLVIVSIALGSLIGEWLQIERRLENLGSYIEKKIGKEGSDFSKGFVLTSFIYCVGAMAITGALSSGLKGDHETLFAKSIIDGITAILFASTLGVGVAFSAISVFVYQGSITLLASLVRDLLTPEVINQMASVGGILIMAIGLNIMDIKKIRIGNMLPAIFIPLLYYILLMGYDKLQALF